MPNWVLKISKPGVDVGTANDPLNFYFDSSHEGGLKVFSNGLGTIGIANNGTSFATITHSLGFTPMLIPYAELTLNKWYVGVGIHYESETIWINGTGSSIGTSTAVLRFNNQSGGSVDVKYKYFLLGNIGT